MTRTVGDNETNRVVKNQLCRQINRRLPNKKENSKKVTRQNNTIMYLILNTKTALLHEHMYDQLNDGKESKQVQERPYKRNWTDKSDTDRSKKRPDYQKQKQR